MRLATIAVPLVLVSCGSAEPGPGLAGEEGGAAGTQALGGGDGSGGARADAGKGGAQAGSTGGKSGAGGSGGSPGAGGAAGTGGKPGTGGAGGRAGGAGTGPDGGTFGGARSQCIHWGPNAGSGTPPALTPGVWTQLVATPTGHFAIDPSNPRVIYLAHQNSGIWKTTDSGSTWNELGTKPDPNQWDRECTWMDDSGAIYVDPNDPQHLYNANGVDATCGGFWVSHDGGQSWTEPAAFPPAGTTNDINEMAVDPCDFQHILTSSHSDWGSTPEYVGGIMESTDGGATWVGRIPDGDPWSVGTKGVLFLNDPATGRSDGRTWLVTDNGFWRTSDAGATWAKVSDAGSPHGTNEFYVTDDGVIYAGAWGYPQRSTDNGLTWTTLSKLPYTTYYAIGSDGKYLYVEGDGGGSYYTSPMSDGVSWTEYTSAKNPARGPIAMHFDPVNRILYSSNWGDGFWALKVE
jgi:hypothetical protein